MELIKLPPHLVQSKEWGEFKTLVGTPAYTAGGVQFTLHKIPLLPYYLAHAPKANLEVADMEEIYQKAKSLKAIAVRFDSPNNISSVKLPTSRFQLLPSPRDTFYHWTVFVDLTKSESELLASFKPKTRYNIKIAEKAGVKINLDGTIDNFIRLQKETSKRQGFFIHSDSYYKKFFETFKKTNQIKIIEAYYDQELICSWVLVTYKNTLFYPYGASSDSHKNLMASNLVAWEAIKLGKKLGCTLFDMWGINPTPGHSWEGVTRFKTGYSETVIEYAKSMDLVINKPLYTLFNLSYKIFWKLLEIKRKI